MKDIVRKLGASAGRRAKFGVRVGALLVTSLVLGHAAFAYNMPKPGEQIFAVYTDSNNNNVGWELKYHACPAGTPMPVAKFGTTSGRSHQEIIPCGGAPSIVQYPTVPEV